MNKKLNPYYGDNNAWCDNISDNISILNLK